MENLQSFWDSYADAAKQREQFLKQSVEIRPQEEFVLKTKLEQPQTLEGGASYPVDTKVFINYCSHEQVTVPEVRGEQFYLGVSCGQIQHTMDNKGQIAICIDFVLNPICIKFIRGAYDLGSLSSQELDVLYTANANVGNFRQFCVDTAYQHIAQKHKLLQSAEYNILKNIKYKGQGLPQPQRIRRPEGKQIKSALDDLCKIELEEDDTVLEQVVKKDEKKTPAVSSSSKKVIVEQVERQLQCQYRCILEGTELSFAEYQQHTIGVRPGEPARGLPQLPSHLIVKILNLPDNLHAKDLTVQQHDSQVKVTFDRFNDRNQSKLSKMLISHPFQILKPHTSVSLRDKELIITLTIVSWNELWLQTSELLRQTDEQTEHHEQQQQQYNKDALALAADINSFDQQIKTLYTYRTSWKEKDDYGRHSLLGLASADNDKHLLKDPVQELNLQSVFLQSIFL